MTQGNNPEVEVLGELTEEERGEMDLFKRQADDHIYELGQLEIRRHQIMETFKNLEDRAATKMRQIGARVGVAEGQMYKIQNNKVIVFKNKEDSQKE